jgi:hypothetical protein
MPDATHFHFTPYARRQIQAHPPRLAFRATNVDEFRNWQRDLRAKLTELLAPRLLLTESASDDGCFPWAYTERAFAKLHQIYRVAEVEDRLDTRFYTGDHRYYGGGVVEFWQKYL